MDTEGGEVAPPTAGILLVGNLATINEVLDRLELQITYSAQVKALALVIACLIVNNCCNGVASEVVVGEPSVGTGCLSAHPGSDDAGNRGSHQSSTLLCRLPYR